LIQEILNFFGRAICHQLEARSLHVSGAALSVCARDTGIYIGIFSTLVYLHIYKRKLKITIPSIKVSFLLLILMVPMIIDGLGSYTHLFQSNNIKRLLSGISFGLVLPYFLYPLLTVNSLKPHSEPVINSRRDFGIPLLISIILGGIFYFEGLPFYLLDSFIILSVIVWFSLCISFLFQFIKHTYYKKIIPCIFSIMFLCFLLWLHFWFQSFTF
jgi:uncharacterized membrane protein